jgi:predicted DNA-binding transcriptional regulator YafY
MNRIDRLFAMLLVLQTRELVRAEELARKFEISQRTVYRDVAALSEMGIPIVSRPSEGYSLMEGYFLPPLVFTPEEAAALMLGARLLALHAEGRLPQDAEQAMTKIAHVLPTQSREQVERWSEIIRFFVVRRGFTLDDRRLVDLQRAITERRAVEITYTGYRGEGPTTRVIEPHYLTYSDGIWYVNSYCRLRQDMRAFRLNRMEKYRLLKETFAPRTEAEFSQERIQPVIEVRARFGLEHVRWVRERQHYGFVREESATVDAIGAGIVMVYEVQELREIQSWLFGWGSAVEVLSPPQLRAAMLAEAQKIVAMLSDA